MVIVLIVSQQFHFYTLEFLIRTCCTIIVHHGFIISVDVSSKDVNLL